MRLIFSDEKLPSSVTKSIFLEGPSPRKAHIEDWRPDAIDVLKKLNYDGDVYIPRWRSQFFKTSEEKQFDYDNQIQWEKDARARSDIIAVWLARSISGEMPGMVTNFELGEDYKRGNVVYGRPIGADNIKYMDLCVKEEFMHVFTSMETFFEDILKKLGDGYPREYGETTVPLVFWKTPSFQDWYSNLKTSGNTLINFNLTSTIKDTKGNIFGFSFKPDVWVNSESRNKNMETVVMRPDVSIVIPYFKDGGVLNFVCTNEFRSAVNNANGYVTEFPGGSSMDTANPEDVAIEELKEECGLINADKSRLTYIGTRQLASTMLSHKANVFTYELDENEQLTIKAYAHGSATLGNHQDGEYIRLTLHTLTELKENNLDFSMLGMLYLATCN